MKSKEVLIALEEIIQSNNITEEQKIVLSEVKIKLKCSVKRADKIQILIDLIKLMAGGTDLFR